MCPKKVLLLGASGSIGKSTLDIIRNFKDRFRLAGFSVHGNIPFAEKIKAEFPGAVFYSTKNAETVFKHQTDETAIKKLISEVEPDIILNGIAGYAGLKASVCAIDAGIDLALANKETIVTAGELILKEALKKKINIIPVDSEHAAIFYLINAYKKSNIEKIIITASGGAFKNTPVQELKSITVRQALQHPTWNMGGKITIDSASLANKALEIIEAVKLFGIPAKKIIPVIHTQSIIHSMIQTVNGEIYAQLSPPDMRNPIFNALTYPDLPPAYLKPLDFSKTFTLDFSPPRFEDFPLLKLGMETAEKLAAYPIAFNSANEEAVEAFLKEKISFTDIASVVQEVLNYDWSMKPSCFKEIYILDSSAREKAQACIRRFI